MKKYICPKVKVVILDPKQAVLEVCVVAGKYMLGTNYCIAGGTLASCNATVRGQPLGGLGLPITDNAPS